jgi:hypothetical protein
MPEATTTLRVPNYASAPGGGVKGQLYVNTSDNLLYYHNGSAWVALASGGVGNVIASGTPALDQVAIWVDATHIKGLGVLTAAQGGTGANNTPTANLFLKGNGSAFTPVALATADMPSIAVTGDITGSGAGGSIATSYNNAVPAAKGGLPTAGTTNQILKKKSNTNYDAEWDTCLAVKFGALTPTLPTTTALRHMGMASSCLVTPSFSGKLLITVVMDVMNPQASGVFQFMMYYGTGTPPASGALATGSAASPSLPQVVTQSSFSITALLTGLPVGTQHWLDLVGQRIAGAAGTVGATNWEVVELP